MMIALVVAVVMMTVPMVVVVMMAAVVVVMMAVVVVLVGEMRGIILVIMMIDMDEGHGAVVQVTDEVGAGAAALRGTEVQCEKVVQRGELKLNSGIEKENKQQRLPLLTSPCKMERCRMEGHIRINLATAFSCK
jgi:hypothetical protein